MTRRIGIALVATFLVALLVPAAPAVAGGGCHSGPTQGEGDTVEMKDLCFTPSNLTIDPGETVTFVNLDETTHNVGGNLWGFYGDMTRGDTLTATFDEAGTYPYACSYHPGMTGAIIVGDGTGPGSGEAAVVDAFEQAQPSPLVEVRTVTEPSSGTPVAVGWLVGAVIGVGLGFGIASLVRRNARPAA
jgi:plastocyanin